MEELVKLIKVKFINFDITPQHLGKIIRDNNKTRKRTRDEHFPKIRYTPRIILKFSLFFIYFIKKNKNFKIIIFSEYFL